jgi:hypothetical protein
MSWNVPEAVSMNIGPVILRTAGSGATMREAGCAPRPPDGCGLGAGRGGGGDRRLEPAIGGDPAPERGISEIGAPGRIPGARREG